MVFLLKMQLSWGTRDVDNIKSLVKDSKITADQFKEITGNDYSEG